MRWQDIDFDRLTWRIPDTKSGEPVVLPLSEPASEVLRARHAQRESDWVFPGTGSRGHLVSPKKAWRRILDRTEALDLLDRVAVACGWSAVEREQMTREILNSVPRALGRLRRDAGTLALDLSLVGLAGLRLHDLRRSMGSWMAATGASLPIIGKSLGHKSAGSTMIYARLAVDPVREAMDKATNALLSAAQTAVHPLGMVTDSRPSS